MGLSRVQLHQAYQQLALSLSTAPRPKASHFSGFQISNHCRSCAKFYLRCRTSDSHFVVYAGIFVPFATVELTLYDGQADISS